MTGVEVEHQLMGFLRGRWLMDKNAWSNEAPSSSKKFEAKSGERLYN